ncbi:glycine cleavage system protein H [Stieleria sp. TO1_6]|uniref:glycine cleavage system protein H n=1 Tax=Stieleria tagensis TaxID=2956795 RepID=UPI00209B3691|nr:glycine cleavage system protein H [Stieleria tagensis]MCO8123007.1 glycine cleavage system protein H [Stieleria tagensis]
MSDTPSGDSFSFAMGEFQATFPTDRHYAKNHMWAKHMDPGSTSTQCWRFGLSAYAVRLLQDVYFLDWEIDPPSTVAARQMIGAIESKKAESDLYSPLAGVFTKINEDVVADPSLINADPYDRGWMIELSVDGAATGVLLSPVEYREHLNDAWEIAQRTIKGQANV